MKIRKAEQSDVNRIFYLGKDLETARVSKKTVAFWPKSTISKIIKGKSNIVLVAEKDKKVIGFIIINYNPSFEKAIMENIYVNESRHQGVGTLLLETAITKLKKKGCKYICTLTKLTEKNTIKWLSHRGMEPGAKFIWSDLTLDKSFMSK